MATYKITLYDMEARMRGREAKHVVPETNSCTIGRGNPNLVSGLRVGCSESEFYFWVEPLQCAIDRLRLEDVTFGSKDSTTEFPLPVARVRHLGGDNKTFISKNGSKTWSEVPESGTRLDDNDLLSFGYHDGQYNHRGYQLLVRIDKAEEVKEPDKTE